MLDARGSLLRAAIPYSIPFIATSLVFSPLIFSILSFPSRQQENAAMQSDQTLATADIEKCQKRNALHKKILLPIFRIQLFASIAFRSPLLAILNIPLLFLYESIHQQQKLAEKKLKQLQENPHLGEKILSIMKNCLGKEVTDTNGCSQQLTMQHFETCEESIPLIGNRNYLRLALLSCLENKPKETFTELLHQVPLGSKRGYSGIHPWVKANHVLKDEGSNPNTMFQELKENWNNPPVATKKPLPEEEKKKWKKQVHERILWEYDPYSFKNDPPVSSEEVQETARSIQRLLDKLVYVFCDNHMLSDLISELKQWEKKNKHRRNLEHSLLDKLRLLVFEIKPKIPLRVSDNEFFPSP